MSTFRKTGLGTVDTALTEEASGFAWPRFLIQLFQLSLLALVVNRLNVELHLGVPSLLVITCGVFTVHSLLAKWLRLPFFFFSCLAAIFYFFGWMDGLRLISYGLLLIGLCHLPIPYYIRVFLVAATGGFLAFGKWMLSNGNLEWAWVFPSSLAISVLGAIFMFRMILYLYELKYETKKISIWHRLSYFFMLPNICFPIFPIVDYKTFLRTYYDKDELDIYQRGIDLIILGVVQLMIYRALYFVAPALEDVDNVFELFGFLTLSYLMLLRLVGILNIAIGTLRLFGFNLPDIFNYMFVAAGFEDLWRRVNIYWKDFIIKIFYLPVYFKLRKRNTILAIVVSTLFAFMINWLLHSYQWFWVLGNFPIRSTELLLWTLLGVLVLIAVLRQQNNPKKEVEKSWSFSINQVTKIGLTFLGMAVLYSLFISPSMAYWGAMLSYNIQSEAIYYGYTGLSLLLIFGISVPIHYLFTKGRLDHLWNLVVAPKYFLFRNLVALLVLLVLSSSFFNKQVKQIAGFSLKPFIEHHLNINDQRKQFKGYYEELMFADNFASPLWQLEGKKNETWQSDFRLEFMDYTPPFDMKFRASSQTVFKGAILSTNSWGFRDKEYAKIPPPNTYRLALIGGSAEMGSGVNDDEVFEQIVENRLNQTKQLDTLNYEILNFAIPGSSIVRNLENTRSTVSEFQPNDILFFCHNEEAYHAYTAIEWLATDSWIQGNKAQIRNSIPWFKEFETFQAKEDLYAEAFEPREEKEEKGWQFLDWSYHKVVKYAAERNAKVILVYLPSIREGEGSQRRFQQLAAKNGMDFLDLTGAFNGYSKEELSVAQWDIHPNKKAHELIAERLYNELITNWEAR